MEELAELDSGDHSGELGGGARSVLEFAAPPHLAQIGRHGARQRSLEELDVPCADAAPHLPTYFPTVGGGRCPPPSSPPPSPRCRWTPSPFFSLSCCSSASNIHHASSSGHIAKMKALLKSKPGAYECHAQGFVEKNRDEWG
uniref:Uncharacterized protein n=1 Tax=Oryza nivara TaxID=4536 RepID=A0A0E0GPL4_ORYNI